ncbi:hypothetical protein [Streptomyces sp. WMMB 322]|uniref:hypothetical protein n=1 Tax=Streptomyces sp. WMMB 322 TaxID=1286821 RepID=UPI000823D9C9|nr:hypothetical protein [Streptomyces sp. WMMB 322]SCK48505.1 hypothetical protein H180DRAFT_04341 [Streptomyces sp. WMMB 322]
MTIATWLPHEVRRCGKQAVVLPVLAALLACVAMLTGPGGGTLLGHSLLTSALPAATALACAAVVAREQLLELHLSLPTPYPRTVARRLAWPAAVSAVSALALVALVRAGSHSLNLGAALLELTGLTVLLAGGAVWATVRSGSAATATGLIVAAVLAKLLLIDRVVPEGAGQGVPALLAGSVLIVLALRALGDAGRSGGEGAVSGRWPGTGGGPSGNVAGHRSTRGETG